MAIFSLKEVWFFSCPLERLQSISTDWSKLCPDWKHGFKIKFHSKHKNPLA
jgi:hypothetical protein